MSQIHCRWSLLCIVLVLGAALQPRDCNAALLRAEFVDQRTGATYFERGSIPDNISRTRNFSADGISASYTVHPHVIDDPLLHFAGVFLPTELRLSLSGEEFVHPQFAYAFLQATTSLAFQIPIDVALEGDSYNQIIATVNAHVPEGFKARVRITGSLTNFVNGTPGGIINGIEQVWDLEPGDHNVGVDTGLIPIGFPDEFQPLLASFHFVFYLEGRGAGDAFIRFTDPGTATETILPTPAVPEPTTLTLWGLAALGCALSAYRRRNRMV